MKIYPFVLVAAAVAAFTASPSLAESITVEYRDLDLSQEKDRATLEQRLDAAAKSVCGTDKVQTGTRVRSASARECYKTARKSIDQQFVPLLAEARRGR